MFSSTENYTRSYQGTTEADKCGQLHVEKEFTDLKAH